MPVLHLDVSPCSATCPPCPPVPLCNIFSGHHDSPCPSVAVILLTLVAFVNLLHLTRWFWSHSRFYRLIAHKSITGGNYARSKTNNRKKKYSNPYQLSRKPGFEKSIRNFKLLKQLLGPPGSANPTVPTAVTTSKQYAITIPRAARKQTPTVTHQFQQSLQQLMETLSHANPFFVRCIKSNSDKMPNHFDDRLVLMQLRYTGMLETVRIRQSGYSVRLTFDEFIQHYRILLSQGLLSSKMDVQQFLLGMKLQPDMYQIGKTKVFMRESEKLVLDERLHEEILRRIINLQRWVSEQTFFIYTTA